MATNIKLGKQEEAVTDANIRKVISLLEPTDSTKPITKTLACQILCISYNTKRLDTIITKFKEAEEFRERKMKENRGKPASAEDTQYIIKEYLTGEPISQIAKSLFRGPQFVKQVLEDNCVPEKPRHQDYFHPTLIPDEAVRTSFEVDEVVYSARYDSLAKIKAFHSMSSCGESVYRIWLLDDKWAQSAYQPASELASLDSIREIGVKL